jgi:hypothetical protein
MTLACYRSRGYAAGMKPFPLAALILAAAVSFAAARNRAGSGVGNAHSPTSDFSPVQILSFCS